MALRFPIAVWEDAAGLLTACTLDGEEISATDATWAGARLQLKRYLAWSYRRVSQPEPDLWEPSLSWVRVSVRPQYEAAGRMFPSDQPVEVRLPCVLGRRRDKSPVCILPTLGMRFQYHIDDSPERIVRDFVQRQLSGLTPRELSRYLPPAHVRIEEIMVKIKPLRGVGIEPQRPTLSSVAEPLADRARRKSFSRAFYRDQEIAGVVRRLGEGANLLLVGDSGVGKSAVLASAARQAENLAARHQREDDDGLAARRRFWLTSGARIIAGMKYLGQWEERCEELIEELGWDQGVLCIENLLELVSVGGQTAAGSVAAFLAPYVERGELRLVTEATPSELDACRRLLPGLVDLLEIVQIPPLDSGPARELLAQMASWLARQSRLELDEGVTDLVYRLYRRFMPYRAFPGPAAAMLRELFESQRSRASREPEAAAQQPLAKVTARHVIDRFVSQVGLPEVLVRDELPLAPQDILCRLRERVIGQEAACQVAAKVITRFKAGLNDPARPLGVLLFCGPTGVGKTELAKTICDYLFGHGEVKERLVRLDMSEYSGYGAAGRLVQQADGQPSQLIQRVRRQPFVVLLLDEIEKASPEVFDVLLGMFDEGRLTDHFGRTTWFRSAVIIMTSNLGAVRGDPIGFDATALPSYEREATAFFRPEFFNRIDEVVTFHPLDKAAILSITAKELTEISRREGLVKAGLRLSWSDRLLGQLARRGYDPRFGARPLQRVLERHVVTPLARWLVSTSLSAGTSLSMDMDDEGELLIHTQ